MKNTIITSQILAAFFAITGHANEGDQPYYFDKLQIASAWELSRGSSDISVAVISTGVSYQYFDAKNLAQNPGESGNGFETDGKDNDGNGYADDVYGVNTEKNSGDPVDMYGIGTHTASLIASSGFGIAPKVKIVPVAVLNENGSGSTENVIKGIEYAASRHVNLIYLGLGGITTQAGYYDKACETLRNTNIPVIAVGGNDATDLDTPREAFHFPQDCQAPNLYLVAAVNKNDELAYFSSYGRSKIDAAAPGMKIMGLNSKGIPTEYSGTSPAASLATGVAALVLSLHPEYCPEQLFKAMNSSVDHSEELTQKTKSGGRLNAYQALLAEVK